MRIVLGIYPLAAIALGFVSSASAQDSLAAREPALRSLVEQLSGAAARDYMTYDFGRARDPQAISVVVGDEAFDLVLSLRAELESGYTAFLGTAEWLGEEDHPGQIEVVVAKIEDKWDILRLARTDAVNYDMLTEDLIDWLSDRDPILSIDILQASTDTIFAWLGGQPSDMNTFLQDLYEFCPDIVDQGTGSVDGLRETIEARVLYLWWD